MSPSAAERLKCFRGCDRFLSGHGRSTPRRALTDAAAEAREDERADVYGAGELAESFEKEIAALLGKEAAVFLPSGTMAQQIALRIWSERKRCATVAFHPTSHLELHEQHGYSFLHGLRSRIVGDSHRLITRADLDAVAEPVAALLLELPQREIGGQLPRWDDLAEQTAWARQRGTALHLDGARVWETQPFYGRSCAEICAPFDSVYVSFYKILGGIAGSALAGPADFVAEARVWVRRHGGNLYTQHPFLLSARAGLREKLPRIPRYVERAAAIARIFAALPGVRVVPDPPPTNMMHVVFPRDLEPLLDASAAVAREHGVCLFSGARATGVPGTSIVEVVIGDAAQALSDDEVASLVRRLL